ncbi:hypothetical protein WAF17_17795 [Bernardetia sp. ABR2-2B]|uniref:hypothetical protein n=1 Tax=Bernardetia sp. ABR2-2B TaxID=3127472 RepID=UPI0030CD1357
MKKLILLALSIFGFYLSAYAQRTCGTELNIDQIKKNEPERYKHIMEMEKFISEHTSNENQRIIDPNGTIIIPVVVHILHDGSAIGTQFNPAMLTVQTQINVLKLLNTNTTNIS